jgi:Cu/Ag efflux pump CusA
VIGGILSSTALTLVVLPVLYSLVANRTERTSHRTAKTGDAEGIGA